LRIIFNGNILSKKTNYNENPYQLLDNTSFYSLLGYHERRNKSIEGGSLIKIIINKKL